MYDQIFILPVHDSIAEKEAIVAAGYQDQVTFDAPLLDVIANLYGTEKISVGVYKKYEGTTSEVITILVSDGRNFDSNPQTLEPPFTVSGISGYSGYSLPPGYTLPPMEISEDDEVIPVYDDDEAAVVKTITVTDEDEEQYVDQILNEIKRRLKPKKKWWSKKK